MTLREDPASAQNIISFSGKKGRAAVLNYSVPLPSSYSGRRILKLDGMDLQDTDWTNSAKDVGTAASEQIGLTKVGGGQYTFDQQKAITWWLENAKAAGVPADQLAELGRWQATSTTGRISESGPFGGRSTGFQGLPSQPGEGKFVPTPETDVPLLWPHVMTYLERLQQGILEKPGKAWGGSYESGPVAADKPKAQPALFLVEVYGISSFLGDYGLGRTVKTFTLLPGEQTTITMKTWRTTTESYRDSSSIVDSFNQSSADRFRGQVQTETTDKKTRSSNEYWHAEAEVSASIGIASASVSGGGGGQYQSGREEFARAVSDAVQEHTQEASSNRDTSVTASSEKSTTTGDEVTTERVIRNVNLRHVLNFVFRELNQSYTTKIHLKDVRVAFTNGGLNIWREVPMSGMRTLLEEVLNPNKIDEVAQKILKLVAVVFDANDQPVPVLETFQMTPDGQNWNHVDAALGQNGEFPPPQADFFYRYKRGPLAQDKEEPNPVDGVLMKKTDVVLLTDSLVVEALLGQADALDEYAMIAQKADAEARQIANERAKIVNEGLAAIADGKERATVYADIVRMNGQLKVELAQKP